MTSSASINPKIIEALYCEALVLSDEIRNAFILPEPSDRGFRTAENGNDDGERASLSDEGLRTTKRMMHAVAWLLNHRAYFKGEMDEAHLRRFGRLSPEMMLTDSDNHERLGSATVSLIETTRQFYARLLRLDQAWRLTGPSAQLPIHSLHRRIERRLAS